MRSTRVSRQYTRERKVPMSGVQVNLFVLRVFFFARDGKHFFLPASF